MSERIRYRKWLLTLFCNATTGFTKRSGLKALKESFGNYDVLIISPYHNMDIDVEPHYHVILQHSNQIDFTKIKSLINTVHCEPQRSNNITAYNYLYHNTKDSKDKYQYDQKDIYCNMDHEHLLLWLGNNEDKRNDSKEVGLDIMATIECSKTLWEVMKSYPEYWRDVSRIKELWYLHKVHKFYENNGWEPDIDVVKENDNKLLSVSLSGASKEVSKEEDLKGIID